MRIQGPSSIRNVILYQTGVSDSHSMDAVIRLLVLEQTKMELQQQRKWRHALRYKARETDKGRTSDRPLLLLHDLFPPRAGPCPLQHKEVSQIL